MLVTDPLAFLFRPVNITIGTEEIKMFLTHSRYIEDGKFVADDSTTAIPVNTNLKIFSTIISTTRTPIKIIFLRMS